MDEVIGPNFGRVLQKRKANKRGMTPARRKRFLDALAGNCNVTRSAQIAGLHLTLLYAVRRRDPQFAAEWQDALATGYVRLEEAVLAYSLRSVGAADIGDAEYAETDGAGLAAPLAGDADDAARLASSPAASVSPESIRLALDVRAKHRNEAHDVGFDKRGRKRATSAETDAVLRRKLDALARKVKAQLGDE
ncbi:MAG: hypothetical protein ACRCSO_00395 [Sphingomonas sp.]